MHFQQYVKKKYENFQTTGTYVVLIPCESFG